MAQRSATGGTASKRSMVTLAVVGALLAVLTAGCAVRSAADGGTTVPVVEAPPTVQATQATQTTQTTQRTPALDGVAYGPFPEQRLDVHVPGTGAGPLRVILYLHSGGWIAGSRSDIPDFLLAQVDRAGIALVSIDYRLVVSEPDGTFVNTFPVPDTDVDRAIRFVKAHARTWNLDPHRVILAGASAGGHLATLAAAAPGAFSDPSLPTDLAAVSPRVQGVLDFVGVSDFTTFGAAGGWAPPLMAAFLDCPVARPDLCDPAEVRTASVATHLDANAPPAFLAYGGTDGLVVSATQGFPLALAWTRARGDSGPVPTWTRGVSFQETGTGHNIDAAALDVDAMQSWIDTVIAGDEAL